MEKNKAVVVIGMHRSGTSLACSLLEKAGVFFGERNDFVRANDENPKGFFEHVRLREINDLWLRRNKASWSNLSDLAQQLRDQPNVSLGELERDAVQFLSEKV